MKRSHVLLALAVLLLVFGALPAGAQAAPQAATSAAARPAASFVYYVLPGDTLAKIATRFGSSITAIMRANPAIKNPNRIYAGQRLVIPVSGFTTQVKIALIAINNGGGVGCNDGVVLVQRQVAATNAPLTAAIRELLSIKQQYYGQSGLYDALYQSNLKIQSVVITNGKAVIRLTGQVSSGGVCDDPRIIAQFERTARQFSTVKSVEVYVNGTLLQTLLSGK